MSYIGHTHDADLSHDSRFNGNLSRHAVATWVCKCVGSVDGATNMWMDGGKWVGTMTDLIWDEDGEMFRLNPRTAVWTPPDPLRRSHR